MSVKLNVSDKTGYNSIQPTKSSGLVSQIFEVILSVIKAVANLFNPSYSKSSMDNLRKKTIDTELTPALKALSMPKFSSHHLYPPAKDGVLLDRKGHVIEYLDCRS